LLWSQTLTNNVLSEQIERDKMLLYQKDKINIEIIEIKLEDLEKSLRRFEEVLKEPKTTIVRDSVIQRFKFTFELFWKVLKKILLYEGEETTTPRDTLSKAYMYHLIKDEGVWISMMLARNKTSHMYNEKEADSIYTQIQSYYPEMNLVFLELQERIKKQISRNKLNKESFSKSLWYS
jgi:nucleotidyltransferase substrate binding protein (TIGR01987 family)